MRDGPKPASPLGGKYFFRNRLARTGMDAINAAGRLLVDSRAGKKAIPAPRRILICNIAHFGDVAMAIAVVPMLKRAFPEAEIGFLAGSWSRALLELFPDIKWIHSFDHYMLNRIEKSPGAKWAAHLGTFRQASREIREKKYDVAIELFYFLQNTIPLLWWAGVPARVGYTSGGFGSLLTHSLDWQYQDQPVLAYHLQLLRFLGVTEALPKAITWPSRKPPPDSTMATPESYVIMHPGGSSAFRSWPLTSWKKLAAELAMRGHRIVFTGRGPTERNMIEQIMPLAPRSLNLCDALDWEPFIQVVEKASLLIGIESLAGHMAAGVGTPSVVIFTGTVNTRQMGPHSDRATLLTFPVPCAPCFLPSGCEGMECVRKVEVEVVLEACLKVLTGKT